VTDDFSKWNTPEGWHNCLVSRPGLTNKEIIDLCNQAKIEFYLRPSYIFKTFIRMLTSWKEAVRIVKASNIFFRYLFKVIFGEKA
jgi:hypothetical protein